MGKKLFYRIGEACKQLDIQPYVLRYWETEFPVLSPRKSKAGQRVYSEEELQLIHRIKQLLYEEGYTIAGAKKKLDAELAEGGLPPLSEDGELPLHAPASAPPEPAATMLASPGTAAAEAPAGSAPADAAQGVRAAVAILDTNAHEQVERLRSGLQDALTQAREILRLLGE